ncbi:MAG: hypothetical protein DMG05_18060 [Acidobacteria bacterium]|nr:MAG: hypothetical protein DMG05_18060 [Acidobacteriota bacterium]
MNCKQTVHFCSLDGEKDRTEDNGPLFMTGNFSLVILTPHSRLPVIVTQHLEKLLSVRWQKLNTCLNGLPLLAAELLLQ